MANSRFAYVRNFELPDPLLPTTYFIVRLDGKGFHGFSKQHNFAKPNDVNALDLMNMAAKRTMEGKELMGECVIGFGESDEYRWELQIVIYRLTVLIWVDGSFVFKKSAKLHGRRARLEQASGNDEYALTTTPQQISVFDHIPVHVCVRVPVASIFPKLAIADRRLARV